MVVMATDYKMAAMQALTIYEALQSLIVILEFVATILATHKWLLCDHISPCKAVKKYQSTVSTEINQATFRYRFLDFQ